MAEHTLTETDNNRTVSVSVGDRIVLRLGESSGAGYSWEVVTLDRARLELRGREFRGEHGIGSAGEAVLTLEAVASGRTHIALRHARPWERRSDDQRFEVVVDIGA